MILTARIPIVCVLAAAILAGCAHGPRSPQSSEGFSALSYNIWAEARDWPIRKDKMLGEIRELNPDVIGIQEALQHENLPNQVETLARELGYEFMFSSVDAPDAAKRFGNGIMTRHPVLATGTKKLDPLNDYRNVAHMRVEIHGHVVDVYNTHLHHTREGGHIRREQIEGLLAFVEETRAGTNVLLLGDFNAAIDQPEMQLVLADYVDTFARFVDDPLAPEHATLNPFFGLSTRRIDYVFQHRASLDAFRPVDSRIVLNEPDETGEIWSSDHFGVMTWFR